MLDIIYKFFDFFKSTKDQNLGANTSTINSDSIRLSEIVAKTNAVEWKEKAIKDFRSFETTNQSLSSACVAFTMGKLLGILHYLKTGAYVFFSPGFIYKRRSNKGHEGMIVDDVYRIPAEDGAVPDVLLPSQKLNEAQINSLKEYDYHKEVAKVFRTDRLQPIWITPPTIEAIASVIQTTGKGVMVWFYFNLDEWLEYPKVKDQNLSMWKALRHSVTAVDFGLIGGKKYIKIEDSAHINGKSVRYLSEEFINKRCILAVYPMNFKFDAKDTKPKFTGTIISLQECLESVGLFPSNVAKIENLGPVTRTALRTWQAQNKLKESGIIDTPTELKLKLMFP